MRGSVSVLKMLFLSCLLVSLFTVPALAGEIVLKDRVVFTTGERCATPVPTDEEIALVQARSNSGLPKGATRHPRQSRRSLSRSTSCGATQVSTM